MGVNSYSNPKFPCFPWVWSKGYKWGLCYLIFPWIIFHTKICQRKIRIRKKENYFPEKYTCDITWPSESTQSFFQPELWDGQIHDFSRSSEKWQFYLCCLFSSWQYRIRRVTYDNFLGVFLSSAGTSLVLGKTRVMLAHVSEDWSEFQLFQKSEVWTFPLCWGCHREHLGFVFLLNLEQIAGPEPK